MNPTPASSFVRALVGFLTFITVSFGVTIAVNTYASAQDREQAAAAAAARLNAPAQ